MRMTSARLRALVLATLLLGLVTAAPMASAAEWADHSGGVCKNYNYYDVSYIDYLPYGTRNVAPGYTYVYCPLSRNTTGTFGADVHVYVTGSPQVTTCTAYSYSYYGALLGAVTNSGTGLIPLPLSGPGYSDYLSNYSVLCYLPGGGGYTISMVDFYEY